MQIRQALSRLFVESVTNSIKRLRNDRFKRTELIIIGIITFLSVANVVILAVAFNYLHLRIAESVIGVISDSISTGAANKMTLDPSVVSKDTLARIDEVSDMYLNVFGGISLMVTLVFGYVVTRITLSPLRQALDSQKRFISNLAHELRTPLSIVRANSEIASNELADNENLSALIEDNIEELDRISGTLNNLLTLSTFRLKEDIPFSAVNIGKVLSDSVAELCRLADNKSITITTDTTDNLLVYGNKSALAQIAMNIIKNAINYTSHQGLVHVSALTTGDGYVEIRVTDSGIGIEEEKLPLIFEPFYQVDTSRSRHKGSGLGLAITNELVKLHHGRIIIKSVPGQGTDFRIQLPVGTEEYRPRSTPVYDRAYDPGNEIMMDYSRRGRI